LRPEIPAPAAAPGRLRLPAPDSLLRLAVVGIILTMVASGLALHLLGVDFLEHLPGRSICPFHAVTSLPCPGCGMTRAMLALGQGRLLAAALFNPLALPLLGLMLAWLGGVRVDMRRHRFALWMLLGTVLVYWTARIWVTVA
jgi:hypothetical protein